jgi:hypothetical protein
MFGERMENYRRSVRDLFQAKFGMGGAFLTPCIWPKLAELLGVAMHD